MARPKNARERAFFYLDVGFCATAGIQSLLSTGNLAVKNLLLNWHWILDEITVHSRMSVLLRPTTREG